jgi:two-component system chemotaxis response regulator CheY
MTENEKSGVGIPIFVLDDDPLNRDLLARVLDRWGYRDVECLEDPLAFMARLPTLNQAILLVDWHMPFMNGLEVLEALRAIGSNGLQLKTVLLTGESSDDLEGMAMKAGAAAVLSKPYALHQLRELLEELVGELRAAG